MCARLFRLTYESAALGCGIGAAKAPHKKFSPPQTPPIHFHGVGDWACQCPLSRTFADAYHARTPVVLYAARRGDFSTWELPANAGRRPCCHCPLHDESCPPRVDHGSAGASPYRRFESSQRNVDPVGRRSRGAHFNPCPGPTSRRVFWQRRTQAVLPLSPSR